MANEPCPACEGECRPGFVPDPDGDGWLTCLNCDGSALVDGPSVPRTSLFDSAPPANPEDFKAAVRAAFPALFTMG